MDKLSKHCGECEYYVPQFANQENGECVVLPFGRCHYMENPSREAKTSACERFSEYKKGLSH